MKPTQNMKYPFIIIDDNKLDCLIVNKIVSFSDKSGQITVFDQAKRALAYISDLQSDTIESQSVIILDLLMPVMDGFQFLDEFLKLPEALTACFKIIVLTLSEHPYTRKRLSYYPIVKAVIEKPLTIEKLNATIQDIL